MSNPATVAVIDDDESICQATASLLRSFGYGVLTYSSAEGFLSLSGGEEPDCIVSDVQMPGLSGIDLLAALSELQRPIPVVLITAYFDDKVVARAMTAGAACILAKPFQTERLLDCIVRAINKPVGA